MPVDHVWSQIIRILKARGGGGGSAPWTAAERRFLTGFRRPAHRLQPSTPGFKVMDTASGNRRSLSDHELGLTA